MSRWINLPEPPHNADTKTLLGWLLDAEELLSKTGRAIIERAAKEIEQLRSENSRLAVHCIEVLPLSESPTIDDCPEQDGTCQMMPQQGRTDNRLNICLVHDAGIGCEVCTCHDDTEE